MKTALMALAELASNMEAARATPTTEPSKPSLYTQPIILGGEEEVILNWEKDDDAF
jgi:hypothetical protein